MKKLLTLIFLLISVSAYSANVDSRLVIPASGVKILANTFTDTRFRTEWQTDVTTNGVETGDDSNQISGYQELLHLHGNIDGSNKIYLNIVDEGGGSFSVDIFKDTARDGANLVGHTANYSVTGSQTIIEDNTSGIAGTLNIDTVGPADTDIIFTFAQSPSDFSILKWYDIQLIKIQAILVADSDTLIKAKNAEIDVYQKPPVDEAAGAAAFAQLLQLTTDRASALDGLSVIAVP